MIEFSMIMIYLILPILAFIALVLCIINLTFNLIAKIKDAIYVYKLKRMSKEEKVKFLRELE